MLRRVAILISSLAAYPAAGDISLALPIDCTLGDDCYIQQVVDQDPSDGIRDFQCGILSYDGHKGTDFALPSRAAMELGVAVLAAAPGEVRAVRNNMVDVLQTRPDAPDVSGVECGNGVVIRHADGWETQYCHLAEGSVAVDVGARVATGDTIGFVGLSGATEFPHLHLSLRRNGDVVDPFDPDMSALCDTPAPALWDAEIPLPQGGLIATGFAEDIPEFDEIKAGTAGLTTVNSAGPAIVLWGYAFGVLIGDEMSGKITGPEGVVFENTQLLDRNQAQVFRAGGRRTPDEGWPKGTYIGEVQILRNGALLDQQRIEIRVE